MGFLLMQYELQRASREVSVHEAAAIRLNNMYERYTKRVKTMESIFDKKQTQLDNQYNTLTSQANQNISTACSGTASAFESMLASVVIGGHCLADFITVGANIDSLAPEERLKELQSLGAKAKTVLTYLLQAAKDADTERLNEQREKMLDPIREKESDLQANATLEDTLKTFWEQRRDAAKQKLPEAIKNCTATYGLS